MTAHRADPPRSRRAVSRLTVILGVLGVALVAIVVAGMLVLQGMRTEAQAQYDAELTRFEAAQAEALLEVEGAQAAIDAAAEVLDGSAGKVLVEDSRAALTTALDDARGTVDAATAALAEHKSLADESAGADPGPLDSGATLRDGAVTLASFSENSLGTVTDVAGQLTPHVDAVTAAMAAWQAEQDRIIAARYTNHVHAVGWTPELDECKGSVDLSAQYGTAAIAEHWSCGGKNFPDEPGTIINLTGVREGTYRVEGIVKMVNQHVATVADIPHGYDLIYQTCQNGQSTTMSLTALTKLD
jgi:hypothetical protein